MTSPEAVASPRSSLLTQMLQSSPAQPPAAAPAASPPAAEAALPPQPSLRDFSVLALVGKGLMGQVYQVRMRDDAIYALKVIPKRSVIAQDMLSYMREERNILANLRHPFVITLHFAFQTSQSLFLILDFVRGGDLRFYLKNNWKLSESAAQFYAAEVFLALQYLHRHNIVHRDLKSANILIDRDGHVVLSDFGLSKKLDSAHMLSGTYCGTLAYMAPEIVRQQDHGVSADWWAFGVLLFEMMVGERPFDDEEVDEEKIRQHILGQELDLPDDLSDEAQSLLRGLLNRDPNARLQGDAIKAHPFFEGVDWDAVFRRETEPPFVPFDDDEGDEYVGNFPSSLTGQTPPESRIVLEGDGDDDPNQEPLFNLESFTYRQPAMFQSLDQPHNPRLPDLELDPDRTSTVVSPVVENLAAAIDIRGASSTAPGPSRHSDDLPPVSGDAMFPMSL